MLLLELPFEETLLTHEDYQKSIDHYKRMKKSMQMSDFKRKRLNKKYDRKNDRLVKKQMKEYD